ncbi:MAG: lipase family protein [Clostridia bacterium]|nr:lipase family protein [Clostridia bacterium]
MKKLVTLGLTLALVFTSTVGTFAATKYTFNWGEYFTQEPRTVDCYYQDKYFEKDSSKYNRHLASASMALSLTGTRSVASENPIDALKKIGCKNIKSVKHAGSKAIVYGQKKIKGGKLVVVNTKATYGFCEWDNNVYFGEKGDLAGYKDICDKTYSALVKYVKKDEKVKFWIAGHSRGGGIANIVAKRLSDKFGKKNVYCYCFDNPYTTTKKDGNAKYTNIHNVLIQESGASVLIPAYMGFDRYGVVDKVFSAADDEEMLPMLHRISDMEYLSAKDFKWSSCSGVADQQQFWDQALYLLEKVMPSREAFCKEVTPYALAAAKKFGYDEAYTFERAARSFAVHLYDIVQFKDDPNHPKDILAVGFNNLLKDKELIDVLLNINPKCAKQYAKLVSSAWKGLGIEDMVSVDEAKDLKLMFATLLEPLLKLVKLDLMQNHKILEAVLLNKERLYDCHVPVTMMAYLMSQDEYYKE